MIVSEETGAVSLAMDGHLYHKIDADTLTLRLKEAAKEQKNKKLHWWQFRKKKNVGENTSEAESSNEEEVSEK